MRVVPNSHTDILYVEVVYRLSSVTRLHTYALSSLGDAVTLLWLVPLSLPTKDVLTTNNPLCVITQPHAMHNLKRE